MWDNFKTAKELKEADAKWEKVGQIQELYMYPLKSGRGMSLRECDFTEWGISFEDAGKFKLRDRMFLVYNEETRRFQTGRQYPTLILVSLSAVDETKVKFLTGTTSGLRLGYTMMGKRNVFVEPWKKFTKVYQRLRSEDTGLFSDLASYMLMTTRSMEELNEKLERPVPSLQFRPNILVSTQQPFEEDQWEWIKIGERVVIRNIKPCTRYNTENSIRDKIDCHRCKLVRVNPENGVMDKEEPLKTLKSEQTDPERISLEGKAPMMGIYCGLYVPGSVKIGDEVFVHRSSDSPVELNHREEEATPR
ncbi:MOSC domain-containing protein 1, mitochondrial [Melipona quadrifasciata]|uniref:MOSC domain-containing protein 1, mitochondrial n=1 Tax=Melipona quadrifasciata TaxID=166423 RepID=A0A0M9A2A5_9HYME|nr:MOSC domain-containing protein 1, mitochondrial [Melipona quadrifasciata]